MTKYKATLYGKDVCHGGKPMAGDLHDALEIVRQGVSKLNPTVKNAMEAGYRIEKVKEHEHAEEMRHEGKGSYYNDGEKNK